jgi:hypothetical protein
LDNKDYGKIKRGMTKKQLEKTPSPEKGGKLPDVKQQSPNPGATKKQGIRAIPTY